MNKIAERTRRTVKTVSNKRKYERLRGRAKRKVKKAIKNYRKSRQG